MVSPTSWNELPELLAEVTEFRDKFSWFFLSTITLAVRDLYQAG
jgi:hypothetical protein